MKVFVTGGTGFVGTHVIKRLIEEKYTVLALTRTDSAALKIAALGAEPVIGDLANMDSWKPSIKGCEVVVHCAAPVEFWGSWHKFETEITLASKSLLNAALHEGVKRFVYISSESVLQDKAPLLDVDEYSPYPSTPNSFYGDAKKLAETELLEAKGNIDIIILRPPFVWGPDSAALKEIATRAKAGLFMWIGNGKSAFEAVHIKNLTEAILLAARHGRGKTVYFVTDDEVATVREFFTDYFTAIGLEVPKKNMPSLFVRTIAAATEMTWRFLKIKKPPPISIFEWAFVGMPRRYNITKIKTDLGYRPIVSRRMGFKDLK
jgi:nucleoside-diphosphate-sugar epimerase